MNNLTFTDEELAILHSWGDYVLQTGEVLEADEQLLYEKIYKAIKPAIDLAKSWEKPE